MGESLTYFFFGPATLAHLEPRLLATVLVPLGEATYHGMTEHQSARAA